MKAIIIGAGKLGLKVAESMLYSEIDVTLVDSNTKVLDVAKEHFDILTVLGSGLDIELLKEIEIESYDQLIAATASDETNTLICSLAKKLGCPKTIARVRSPEYMQHLAFIQKELGIDLIVNPDLMTAQEISRFLLKNYNFYSGDLADGKVQLLEIAIPAQSSFSNKRIMDLPDLNNIIIAAITREEKTLIPDGSTVLQENDLLYIIGRTNDILQLTERFQLQLKKRSLKRAMILGGGNIGFYLAEKLSNTDIDVSLIELNKERCKYLAEHLSDVLIIQGDGTQLSLLEEEGLGQMDAFISVSGFDEQNLLMALVAKQAGVHKTVAKISRPNYAHLIKKLDIDVALSPVNITAGEIMKYIRGGRVISISQLLGSEAEVTEIIVGKGLNVVGQTIAALGLPKGIIIGAIVRENKVMIPDGQTVIQAEDRLIIFCLESNLAYLDIFLENRKPGVFAKMWKKNQGLRKLLNP